jgi:hypothetical protein
MHIRRVIKPVIVLTLAAFVFSTAGFAQVRKHDVSVAYGFLSIDQVTDMLTDIVTIVITLGTFSKDNIKYTGVPFLTYHYSSNSRFGFGFAAGGYNSRGDLRVGNTTVGDFTERNYIGAVELDYHWVMREGLQLYSGAGFGVRYRKGTYTDADDTDTAGKVLPTFHLNALGLRVGKKVGVFVEFGVGYKGILSAGVNAQF